MPYFIDFANLEVIVRPPGATAEEGQAEVDGETAIRCDLAHGQKLTAEQAQALLDGSPSRFRALLVGAATESDEPQSLPGAVPTPRRQTPTTQSASTAPFRASATQRANRVASIVEVVSWIVRILSVISGVVSAAQTRVNMYGDTVHPFVWRGIGFAIVGSFHCLVMIMFATYIEAKTE